MPPAVVTTMRDGPAGFAGLVTETDVDVLEMIVAAVPPNVTADGLARLVPMMITVVPPVVGPEVGFILVIVGADIVKMIEYSA